jgi:hypothetical protein
MSENEVKGGWTAKWKVIPQINTQLEEQSYVCLVYMCVYLPSERNIRGAGEKRRSLVFMFLVWESSVLSRVEVT